MTARIPYRDWAVDDNGDVVSGADVTVRKTADNALATLYAAATGGTTLTNPFAAGDGTPEDVGAFEFWVDPGEYELTLGVSPTDAVRRVSLLFADRVQYATRVDLVTDRNTNSVIWPEGTIITDGTVSYVYSDGATAIPDLPNLLPYGLMVTPWHFGAVGDGSTDDTTALQAALDYDQPIWLRGIFVATAQLTGNQARIYGGDPHLDGILWEGATTYGFAITPTSYADKIYMNLFGVFTAETTPASVAVTIDWESLGTDYSDWARQIRRTDFDGLVIIGKDADRTTYGWLGGIYMTRPQQCKIEGCTIWGKFDANEYDSGDFESAYGIHVEPPTTDDSVDMKIVDNVIYGWLDACYIDSMEAVDFHENDVQVCFRGFTCHARITSRNQYRFTNNHMSCSDYSFRLRNLRQFLFTANDISYRWGSTATESRHLVKLDSAYRGAFTGNTFRAGSPGNITLTAVLMEQTDASLVRDVTFAANSFADMDYILGATGAAAPIDLGWSKSNRVRGLNEWYDDGGLGTDNLLGGGVISYNNTAETVTATGTSTISILDFESYFEFTESAVAAITRNIDLRTIQSPLPGTMVRLKFTFDNNADSVFRLRSGSAGSVFHTVRNTYGTVFSVGVLCVYDGSAWTAVESAKIDTQPGVIEAEPSGTVTPLNNGDVVFELTSNTTLTVKAKGGDGIVRSDTLTLS